MTKPLFEYIIDKIYNKDVKRFVVCPSAIKDCGCYLYKHGIPYVEGIDERSAGYIATGMSHEANEPVAILCSGNSTFRNLTSAMTEAYYRKLPILVLTIDNSADLINQTVNPQDIFTAHCCISNSLSISDIDNTVEEVIVNLNNDKPVFLELTGYNRTIIESEDNTHAMELDASSYLYSDDEIKRIVSLISQTSCVHIGSKFSNSQKTIITKRIPEIYCNDGANAVDGRLATLIGSSVVAKSQLHVGIFSEDECIYDLNMFGNRHVGSNVIVFIKGKTDMCATILEYAENLDWDVMSLDKVDGMSFDKISKPVIVKIN